MLPLARMLFHIRVMKEVSAMRLVYFNHGFCRVEETAPY
jgi:hypothetical protein